MLTLFIHSLAPLTLAGQGTPGITWAIQRSRDLINWEPAGNLTTNAHGTGTFTDPQSPASSGPLFYRGRYEL